MRCGLKARPYDIKTVISLNPEVVEIHASSDDMVQDITDSYNLPLIVHFPEYDGTELMDSSSLDESKRLRAERFYNNCFSITRKWGENFKGKPKAILHPGGWSIDPTKSWEKHNIRQALKKTLRGLNHTGVDFLIENMPPKPWFYGGQWYCNILMEPVEILDFCLTTGRGLCLDLCHAFLWCQFVNYDIIQFVKKVKPVTAHIHISDGKGTDGEGIQIDEGDMPMAQLIQLIKEWNVGVVPECWWGHKNNYGGFRTAWSRISAHAGINSFFPEGSNGNRT